jgi:hypothetical protein
MNSVAGVIPQLRTTDLAGSIRFYTEKVGFTLEFQYEDFYAGIRAGSQIFHLKLAAEKDPSIELRGSGRPLPSLFRDRRCRVRGGGAGPTRGPLVTRLHETPWGTREFVIKDDQGHTLYFGEQLKTGGG